MNQRLAEIEEIFNCWNLLGCVPKVLLISDQRRRHLEARLSSKFFRDNWRVAMDKIKSSPFLCGQSERGWKANFDWFIRPDSVLRIMEGKYDRVAPQPAVHDTSNFWATTKELEMVQQSIKQIGYRGTHTAMGLVLSKQDKPVYDRLKARRKVLQQELGLI